MGKKELSIGDVVAVVDKAYVQKFRDTGKLRQEAQLILSQCAEKDAQTWEELAKKYNLSQGFHYQLNHITRQLTVNGRRA